MNTKKRSVIVADSHAIFRQGIKNVLSSIPNIEIASEAESSESLVSQVEYINPDIVILDMLLPGMDCFMILREMNAQYPEMIFIVISSFDDHAYSEKVLSLGARAFLKKDNLSNTLTQCVNAIAQDQLYINSTLVNQSVTVISDEFAISEGLKQLSIKEISFLKKISVNLNHLAIANDLGLSYQSIRATHSSLCEKFEVKSDELQSFAKSNIQRISDI